MRILEKLSKTFIAIALAGVALTGCDRQDPTYTIKWVVEGNVVEVDENVTKGSLPSYDGEEPTKEGSAEFTYTFSGWTPEVVTVTEDATYTATFIETKNSYTVSFVNWDGSELQTSTVEYGVVPVYEGETPTREATEEELATIDGYMFVGWDKEIVAVSGNTTYTAVFEAYTYFGLCYSECALAVSMLFGEEYVQTFVKTNAWETNGIVYLNVSVGAVSDTNTLADNFSVVNSLLTNYMGYSAAVEPTVNQLGQYTGVYLNLDNGVVCYPFVFENASKVIIQMQFTHFDLLA